MSLSFVTNSLEEEINSIDYYKKETFRQELRNSLVNKILQYKTRTPMLYYILNDPPDRLSEKDIYRDDEYFKELLYESNEEVIYFEKCSYANNYTPVFIIPYGEERIKATRIKGNDPTKISQMRLEKYSNSYIELRIIFPFRSKVCIEIRSSYQTIITKEYSYNKVLDEEYSQELENYYDNLLDEAFTLFDKLKKDPCCLFKNNLQNIISMLKLENHGDNFYAKLTWNNEIITSEGNGRLECLSKLDNLLYNKGIRL